MLNCTYFPRMVANGMANNRIGVARLDLPDRLPAGEGADSPEATV
jgi:hypothetical protein